MLDQRCKSQERRAEQMGKMRQVAEERAKKSMIDAARLADELRAEQENAQAAEKNRRGLDCQVN